ncbi:MAG: acetyl-CoA carboxylase biotin carboxyl carrier protein [Armatimonadetes bacterium]|nr:acetyl-CoA carboxylase biotin carboxyl carrier protein [Armatimonadota bacterium]
MAEIDSTPETVRRLVALVAEHGLAELTVEAEGVQITVKAVPEFTPAQAAGPVAVPAHPQALPPAPVYSQPPVTAPAPAPASRAGRPANAVALESPMVGVFYRSPSPEDPPFVSVGDTVRVGQPIGLIEAMKVFSEVPAEAAGRVVDIPIESGTLVHQGQPLMHIEPL